MAAGIKFLSKARGRPFCISAEAGADRCSDVKSAVWPVLGLARFALALIVAGCHLPSFVERGDFFAGLKNFSGLVAVMAFLVVSGFSIAASYERDREQFYFRRALRILPLYVPIVTISAVLPFFCNEGALSLDVPCYEQVFLNLCFTQGFIVDSLRSNPVVWTLSLEVFFYAITPVITRLSNRALLATACACAFCYVNSSWVAYVHHAGALFGVNVVLLGWCWILGFWIYRERGRSAELALAVGVVAVTLNHFYVHKWWIFSWSIPFAALALAQKIELSPRLARAGIFLGDISYPFYLSHFPLYVALDAMGAPKWGALFLGCGLVLALALDLFVDKPAKRLLLGLVQRLPEASLRALPRLFGKKIRAA